MSLPPVGSTPPIKPPENAEPKGPELSNDHDGDDAGAAKPAAALPRGQGTLVDKKA